MQEKSANIISGSAQKLFQANRNSVFSLFAAQKLFQANRNSVFSLFALNDIKFSTRPH